MTNFNMKDLANKQAELLFLNDCNDVMIANVEILGNVIFGDLKIYKDYTVNITHNFAHNFIFKCEIKKQYGVGITVDCDELDEALDKDDCHDFHSDYEYGVGELLTNYIKNDAGKIEDFGELIATYDGFIDELDAEGNRFTDKLFRNEKGEFILYQVGGEFTDVAQGKPPIDHLSIIEAIGWCELYAKDKVTGIFGVRKAFR